MEGYTGYKKIPNKLRLRRKALGYKQEVVAEILGLKHVTKVSRWENGRSLPTLVNAFRLAGLYKGDINDLFYDLMARTRSEMTSAAAGVFERRKTEGRALSTARLESLTG